MKRLIIEITENGFLVSKNFDSLGSLGKQWVFEDPGGLAVHIEDWADKVVKERAPVEPVNKRQVNPEMDNLTHITLAPLRTQIIQSQNSVRRSLSILEGPATEYSQHQQLLLTGYNVLLNLINKMSADADNIGKGK